MAHINNFHIDHIIDLVNSGGCKVDSGDFIKFLRSYELQPDNKLRTRADLYRALEDYEYSLNKLVEDKGC